MPKHWVRKISLCKSRKKLIFNSDIGSGTGYLCAVFALMVGKTGKVVGIEHIPQLVNRSIENIKRWNSEYLDNNVIELIGKKQKIKIIIFKI